MISYENPAPVTNTTSSSKDLPWVEKYRPRQIDDIISHREIIQSLKKFINMKTLPHLLFFGPSGSGKTSTIMCCANEIYGRKFTHCMILQINASNERGIEIVRNKIKNFVSNKNSIFLPPKNRNVFKLVILDEIDSMTVEAQGMLRQTIEKNSTTTRFCLICNDIDRINIALQSRCTLYRFAPLNEADMKSRLQTIGSEEKIPYNEDSLDAIIAISKGDMRTAINTLQHVSLTVNHKISPKDVYKISGHCIPHIISDIFLCLGNLTNGKISIGDCIEVTTKRVIDNNITIFNLLEELKNMVMASKLKTSQKIFLVDNFALNEVYDSVNVDPKNIIMIITSLFVLVSKI